MGMERGGDERAEPPSNTANVPGIDSVMVPICRTKIFSLSELSAFLEKNKHKPNKLVVIHTYSHTRVADGEVEMVERRIVKEISHAIFLDADLDADWTKDLFYNDNERETSNYSQHLLTQLCGMEDLINEGKKRPSSLTPQLDFHNKGLFSKPGDQ
ncbi:unnamed protein product [Darwinula stevensoni]|uniref:Uncharacterized protein n=1 Tax=Darwinula stevensoni TaxID=69355 RepID=A0A7R8XFC3_9CRUS|nr:unnamed protein product [Darwinula stevensoni]CAG0895148.1 unnamed protein product [Darwinula stevensoni]